MTRLLAAALLMAGVTISAQTDGPAPLAILNHQFTLGNGLHVILHQDNSVPVVSVNIWYHVGSANEKPGRTGFAHLFEHLMFEGSKHVPEGALDMWLEAAGGNNNGSTNPDRTNYYMDIPSNALELGLFIESDRMASLLDTMTPQKVDGQRDVVKNERRQSYENQPYGRAFLELGTMLYPKDHPYSWPTIGSMEDLTAASYDDVVQFFKTYYVPNNASLVIAGDIDISATRNLVEKWFGDVPRGSDTPPIVAPPATLTEVKKQTMTDRVQLPRLYLAWHTPALYAPGDAAMDLVAHVLAGGKTSRLYKRLVYDMQIAQDVSAFQQSQGLGSAFLIIATARPGQGLERIQSIIDEEIEKLRNEPPEAREVRRGLNQIEAAFYRQMERVGGFSGKANQLNAYYTATRMPDFFAEDLARYQAISPTDVQAIVDAYLRPDRRVELTVMPEGSK